VHGRHPLQTSDAVGAAAVQLGPQAVAIAASFNKQLGLSFSKIETVFADRFGLTVTRGNLGRGFDFGPPSPAAVAFHTHEVH
jgi:hypothetical protein